MSHGGKRAGAGRIAGKANKRSQEVLDAIEEQFPGYHPVVAMAAVANDPNASPEMRFQAHKEVAQYVAPKRRSIEASVTNDLHVTVKQFGTDDT